MSLESADYAHTGTRDSSNEVATTGARIRTASAASLPAIVASPSGIKIGTKTLDQTWLASGRIVAAQVYGIGDGNASVQRCIGGPSAPGGTASISSGTIVYLRVASGSGVSCNIIGNGVHTDGATYTSVFPSGYTYSTDANGDVCFVLCSYTTPTTNFTNLNTKPWWVNVVATLGAATWA